MAEKITKYKKYILGIAPVIMLLTLFFSINNLMKNKNNEPLPEIKLREINKSKAFAIMIQNENGEGYKEYKSDDNKWPGKGYKFKEAQCTDNSGNLITDAVTFADGKATLQSDKTIYCTLYFDIKPDPAKDLRAKDPSGSLSEDLVGGMYRYQGTGDIPNWIIFGTREKCEKDGDNCTNIENMTYADYVDKYMYRIIGITDEGQMYLIKETFLKEESVTGFAWNDEAKIDSGVDLCPDGKCPEWNEADLFQRINGTANGTKAGKGDNDDKVDNDTDIFVDSEYYDYLKSGDNDGINGSETASEWFSLIADHDWMYGDTTTSSYNGETLYAIETGAEGGETTHYVQNPEGSTTVESQNYKWPETNKVNAKISLMYLHDVAYAYPGGNPGNSTNVANSWIHFRKDGYNTSQSYEWLSTRWGIYSTSYADVVARSVNDRGSLADGDNDLYSGGGVRPVFYLESRAKIAEGDGTKDLPFILS